MNAYSESGGLQFERADAGGAAGGTGATCTACSRAIADTYFEVNGKVVCPACRGRLVAEWNRSSRGGRFFRALVLGLLAGGVGAGIYYAIAALTGYEFGLVAIVVGLLVGGAVRKGSNGRGGWAYQALAMFITYLAIVTTYIPFIIEGVREGAVVRDSVIGLVTLFVLAFAAPVLAGFQNIIGMLIIGFALYEAWKINKRAELAMTGPYRVAAGDARA